MDKGFKWNMFITSFIPLWLSIVVADIWSIIENGIKNWSYKYNIIYNMNKVCQENIVSISVVLVTVILMTISICSINRFLKDKIYNIFCNVSVFVY